MSNYVKATNFATKDTLLTGNPDKIIKGTEIDTEYNSISTAITSKADILSPAFTGTPTAPTASAGTNTTQIATTGFVTSSQGTMASQNANAVAITGGSVVGITDLLPADGGTGVSSLTQNALVVGNGTGAVTSIRPSTTGNLLTSTVGATVTAGAFVIGTQYTILTVGTTSFTAIGASANTVGVIFTATGVGSGDGTATTNVWTSEIVAVPPALSTASGSAPSYSARAFVNFDGVTQTTQTGTYSQSGTTVTVTVTAHGYTVGQAIGFDATSGSATDGIYAVVTVPTANTFTYTAPSSTTTSGNVTLRKATIRGSSNVSSVVCSTGTGVFGINFTIAMPNANYACMATCSSTSGSGASSVMVYRSASLIYAPTTQYQVVFTRTDAGSNFDAEYVNAVIFA